MIDTNQSSHNGTRLMKGLVLGAVVAALGLHAAWRYGRDTEASDAARTNAFITRHVERCVARNTFPLADAQAAHARAARGHIRGKIVLTMD